MRTPRGIPPADGGIASKQPPNRQSLAGDFFFFHFTFASFLTIYIVKTKKEATMAQPKIYTAKNGTKFVHYTKEKIVIQDPKNRTWATKGCK